MSSRYNKETHDELVCPMCKKNNWFDVSNNGYIQKGITNNDFKEFECECGFVAKFKIGNIARLQ